MRTQRSRAANHLVNWDGRHVDRNPQLAGPGSRVFAGLAQHPSPIWPIKPASSAMGMNKRRDRAAAWVVPPDQRFHPGNVIGSWHSRWAGIPRLISPLGRASRRSSSQRALVVCDLQQLTREEAEAPPATRLGCVERKIRIADQF